jgi:hypothetical protein
MHCFNHDKESATGICISCGKGLCNACTTMTPELKLCCGSDSCKHGIYLGYTINMIAKKFYGIGEPQRKAPYIRSIFFILVGLLFMVFGLIYNTEFSWLIYASMGIVFIILGVMSYSRTKKLGGSFW